MIWTSRAYALCLVLGATSLAACAEQPVGEAQAAASTASATQPETERVVKRFVEFLSTGDPAIADEVVAPDIVCHVPGAPDVRGIAAYKQWIGGFHTALSGLKVTLDDKFSVGERAVIRFTFSGKHTGELGGLKPTGDQIGGIETHTLRIKGGKVVENYVSANDLELAKKFMMR